MVTTKQTFDRIHHRLLRSASHGMHHRTLFRNDGVLSGKQTNIQIDEHRPPEHPHQHGYRDERPVRNGGKAAELRATADYEGDSDDGSDYRRNDQNI